ncbi:IclR family transcriptional regulator [Microbacterium sp. NPDC008134]|uniref:IclR family transcriptional regulator n=1 Tax=Microbacterium sp. NPDC008134 TaxID=3364183 RepID=UPI0036EAE3F5
MAEQSPSYGQVPAAEQVLDILSLLAASRGPLPAATIASRLGLPRSTVYHLLTTLQTRGFVLHLTEERRYGLGMSAVELSFAYQRHEPLSRLGAPLLAALVDEVGFSGHLPVPHGRDMLYVLEQRARGARHLITDVDVRLPMAMTASGRAVLAAMPRAQARTLFPDRGAFETRHGDARDVDRYSTLRSILTETAIRGFAVERDLVTDGFSSIAAPILDHRDWPIAAVALTFEYERETEEQVSSSAAALLSTAAQLSARVYRRRHSQ